MNKHTKNVNTPANDHDHVVRRWRSPCRVERLLADEQNAAAKVCDNFSKRILAVYARLA